MPPDQADVEDIDIQFERILELEDQDVIHQLSLWDDWMEGELDMW